MNPLILGVDPGLSGALAFYAPLAPDLITAEDVPVVGAEIDAPRLARRLAQLRPTVAMIELATSMPKQGVASTFKYGRSFGTVLGVIGALGIPYHFTSPARWKKHFRLNSDKEQSRTLAVRLWPAAECFSLKKHHGRAEAALIARYGAETLPEARIAA